MGSLYLRRGRKGKTLPTWWLKYRGPDGRTVRESTGTTNKVVARRILKVREGDSERGIFVPAKQNRIMFWEAAKAVLEDYQIHGRRSLDHARRRFSLHLSPVFGQRRLAAILPSEIKTFVIDRQNEGAANGEINRELALLRRTFSLALKGGLISAKPSIEMLPEAEPRQGFVLAEQFEKIAARLRPAVAAPVRFAYFTGWRIRAEVFTLEWRHVDWDAECVRLEGKYSKNGEPRPFPFGPFPQLLALLEQQRAEHERLARDGVICPHVFHRKGKQVRDLRRAWESACTAAGYPGRLLHDLRRSAVRNLVRAGVSEEVAKSLTGHKTNSVFSRYNITSEEDQLNAVRRLGTLLGTPTTKTASAAGTGGPTREA